MSTAELIRYAPNTMQIDRKPYSVEWDSITDKEWDQIVNDFSDGNVYQTATYGRIRMRGNSCSRLIVRREANIVGLCLARIYRAPLVPFGVAKVTFGPLWKRKGENPEPANFRALLRALYSHFCRDLGLGLRIDPHSYEGDEGSEVINQIFHEEGFARSGLGGLTPVMNLASDMETLRKNLEKKWRNRLNTAEKHGLHVTLSTMTSDFDRFCQVYFEMRRRKQYQSHENVPQFRKCFVQTEETLRPRVALCWKDERVVAGAIISWLGDSALYLYGGTSDEGLTLQAANLLHWSIVKWAKEHGFSRYDLMSTSENAPWFKRGLCGRSGADVRRIGPFVAARYPWNWFLLRFL